MKNEEDEVIEIIKSFLKDINDNLDYIKNKIQNEEITNHLEWFVKKYTKDQEIKKIQLEKIGNFLKYKKSVNKPPQELGVYFVVSLNEIKENDIRKDLGYHDIEGKFVSIDEKGKFKSFAEDEIKKKLKTVMNNNNHTKILYIGTAEGEKGLYARIVEQYMGSKYNHSGGRIIWQIEGVENLYIAWIPVKYANKTETGLIQSYAYLIKKIKGDNTNKIKGISYYPLANRKN